MYTFPRASSFLVPTQVNECDEDKELEDKLQEWNTIDAPATIFDDNDKIFHPDDEIILDPKESSEAPIARVLPRHCELIAGKYRNASTGVADRGYHLKALDDS